MGIVPDEESARHLDLEFRSMRYLLLATLGWGIALLQQEAHAAEPLDTGRRGLQSPLQRRSGMSAMLSDGGTASVTDVSSVDNNPAGLGITRELAATGEFSWKGTNAQFMEGGVLDSFISDVLTAGVKARQTTKHTGGKDRRFTLGLAGHLTDSSFVFGAALDYTMLDTKAVTVENPLPYKNATPFRARFGGIFLLSESIRLGVRSDGYFDDEEPLEHAAGVAWLLGNAAVINADVVFLKKEPWQYIVGASIFAKGYLDVHVSYGYDLNSLAHRGSAGAVFKSNQFRLYYTLSKPRLSEDLINHTIGATAVLSSM